MKFLTMYLLTEESVGLDKIGKTMSNKCIKTKVIKNLLFRKNLSDKIFLFLSRVKYFLTYKDLKFSSKIKKQ